MIQGGELVEKSIHKLVKHIPVNAVLKGNPAHVALLENLAKPGVRIAPGDPKGLSMGSPGGRK